MLGQTVEEFLLFATDVLTVSNNIFATSLFCACLLFSRFFAIGLIVLIIRLFCKNPINDDDDDDNNNENDSDVKCHGVIFGHIWREMSNI